MTCSADEIWMKRCFELARRGAGAVSPNPLVGAVLVHNNRIIAEGWHERWGVSIRATFVFSGGSSKVLSIHEIT
ncbi:MAG: hypothetical protein ACKOZV_14730 [Bacteroidota bacterium]